MEKFNLKYANRPQRKIGWALNPEYLKSLQSSIDDFEIVSLEGIEAALLIASGQKELLYKANDRFLENKRNMESGQHEAN